MITHVVMFKLADQNDREEAIERLRALRGQIPTMLSMTCGSDTTHFGNAGDHAFDIILMTEHPDLAGLAEYQVHPAHQAVLDWLASRRIARAVVDSENFS